jgi:ATP-binding cassette subfamily F protein uup
MDEPTNDLDVETLELLEELLADWPGTLLLVSHDRDFLDAVVTSTLVMEGGGRVGDYVGGYSDWLRQRPVPGANALPSRATAVADRAAATAPSNAPTQAPTARKRLGHKEQRELEQLPARIETLEARIAELTAQIQDPQFYRQPAATVTATQSALAAVQADLDLAYARWAALEGA